MTIHVSPDIAPIDAARPDRALSILHLAAGLDETCPTYNEHCLPAAGQRRIGLCTYFAPAIAPSAAISVFAGDGTLRGFYRALDRALAADDYDLVHAHAPHFAALLLPAHLRYRRTLPARLFTVHNSFPNFKFRNKLFLALVFAYANKVVCCSQASADSFPAPYRRLAGRRFTSVANGVDVDRVDRALDGRAAPASGDAPFTVMSVGRLIAIKNPLTLLQAYAASAADAADAGRMVFIGEGGLAAALRSAGAGLTIADQIEMAGLLDRDDVFRRLRRADLFVSTSTGEGLPIATLEAMACGCPVLLSDIPPHREIAAGTDFIPLLDAHDAAGFAREITRFRRLSPTARAALGARCRALVERRFSLRAMSTGYDRLYRQLRAGGSADVGV